MSAFVLLEVGNLGGLVFMIILVYGSLAILGSCFVAFLFKVIYESNTKKKLTRGQYWLAVFVGLSICGVIAGAICL